MPPKKYDINGERAKGEGGGSWGDGRLIHVTNNVYGASLFSLNTSRSPPCTTTTTDMTPESVTRARQARALDRVRDKMEGGGRGGLGDIKQVA